MDIYINVKQTTGNYNHGCSKHYNNIVMGHIFMTSSSILISNLLSVDFKCKGYVKTAESWMTGAEPTGVFKIVSGKVKKNGLISGLRKNKGALHDNRKAES